MRRIFVFVCLASALATPAFAERVIIKCGQSCESVAKAVQQDGGRLLRRYKYVTAVVADVSDLSLPTTRALVDAGAIRKDLYVHAIPMPRDVRGAGLVAGEEVVGATTVDADSDTLRSAEVGPAAFTINNVETNVQPLLAAGFTGTGMKVAVIDTGIRPGFPHLSLDNSVIGGEDFVNDGLGYSNPNNNGHGTFVAGMISANVTFTFAPDSAFLAGISAHCPSCVLSGNRVPMIGSAPNASIYAVRVLDTDGSGRQSAVLAAMERVIDLRRAYDGGASESQNPDGSFNALNIRVANMSLGGVTLFPGRDVQDEMTNAFLENDIVLVVSAGNQGPSGDTIGSPGSGFGALTVGAASTAVHERILREIQLGPGGGVAFRPFGGTQTAFFSSRGPNADGRPDPDIVANGFASFGQGLGASVNTVSIASGTSFSAPTVAGIAAVLRQAVPNATARQVRNALILTADRSALNDGSRLEDRGTGFVNAAAARALLATMMTPDVAGLPGFSNRDVANNYERIGIDVLEGSVRRSTGSLLPGQRYEIFYRVEPNTAAVVITVGDVTLGTTQNELFGDDLLVAVHSAKTSGIGETGDYKVFDLLRSGSSYTIDRPEPGVMRVTLNGDWTNASTVAASVKISSILAPDAGRTARSRIADGQTVSLPFTVAAGTKQLSVEGSWEADWGSYPANDLDVFLVKPDGKLLTNEDGSLTTDGATLNSPERIDVADPTPGRWFAVVQGFQVNSKDGDKVTLRVTADGRVIRQY